MKNYVIVLVASGTHYKECDWDSEVICVYTEKELVEILQYYKDTTYFERNDFVACKTSDSDLVADYIRMSKIDKIYIKEVK